MTPNRQYERDAIAKAQRVTGKSPVTNQPISDNFRTDRHTLRAAERLVRVSGVIPNAERAEWYRRRAEVLLKQRRQEFDNMDSEIRELLAGFFRLS